VRTRRCDNRASALLCHWANTREGRAVRLRFKPEDLPQLFISYFHEDLGAVLRRDILYAAQRSEIFVTQKISEVFYL